MKTEQLMAALVADRGGPQSLTRSLGRTLALALLAGGAMSLVPFFAALGPRKDLAPALATWRFDLKLVVVLLALVVTFFLCRALFRPVPVPHPGRCLLPLVALAAVAVLIELAVVPMDAWWTRLVGSNSLICLTAVPALSLAPLAAVLAMARSAAPASPALAGAAAGLLAAAAGATLYAFHCFDDSPLFVVAWYALATVPMVAIGALAGCRLLRW
jgi:hypothetical protein